MNSNKPFPMPTGYFGIVLGLAALSLAWSHSDFIPFSMLISHLLGVSAVVIWGIFITLFVYKIIAYRQTLLDEWHCPVRFSFLALVPITTMLIGAIFYRFGFILLAEVLIWLGTIAQLAFSTIRIGSLWQGNLFTEQATLPPFYLPSVAANFTSASTLALIGYHDLAYLFLGAGMLAWIMFEPVLLQYLRTHSTEHSLRATFGIILAPAFVGSSAYLSINGGQVDLFVKLLWGYGILQLLYLVRLLPWLFEKGFSVGFWAFSFGFASLANGATFFYHQNVMSGLALVLFGFSSLVIFALALATLAKVIQGKFWVK